MRLPNRLWLLSSSFWRLGAIRSHTETGSTTSSALQIDIHKTDLATQTRSSLKWVGLKWCQSKGIPSCEDIKSAVETSYTITSTIPTPPLYHHFFDTITSSTPSFLHHHRFFDTITSSFTQLYISTSLSLTTTIFGIGPNKTVKKCNSSQPPKWMTLILTIENNLWNDKRIW